MYCTAVPGQFQTMAEKRVLEEESVDTKVKRNKTWLTTAPNKPGLEWAIESTDALGYILNALRQLVRNPIIQLWVNH